MSPVDDRIVSPAGTAIPRTRRVMAIANMPSVSASKRDFEKPMLSGCWFPSSVIA